MSTEIYVCHDPGTGEITRLTTERPEDSGEQIEGPYPVEGLALQPPAAIAGVVGQKEKR